MTETEEILKAVLPARGTVIHLYRRGYKPGARARSVGDRTMMCGVGLVKQELVPLAEALAWPGEHPDWTWCKVCIGHAVVMADMAGAVVSTVAARVPSGME